jgi:hypothetical protein
VDAVGRRPPPRRWPGHSGQPLRDLGFDDQALLEVGHIVGIFNYLTRLADGFGLQLDPQVAERRAPESRSRAADRAELTRSWRPDLPDGLVGSAQAVRVTEGAGCQTLEPFEAQLDDAGAVVILGEQLGDVAGPSSTGRAW